MSTSAAERLGRIEARLEAACARAGRERAGVTLVAASKYADAAGIAELHDAGQRHFGENRVQDAVAKAAALAGRGIEWHMIGHLQTNKAAAAAGMFAMVESIDSVRSAEALARAARAAHRVIPVLLQVNVGADPAKSGFAPDVVRADLGVVAKLEGIEVRGLMTIGPLTSTAEESRPTFAALRELRDELDGMGVAAPLEELSMGMSADFEVAIEEGATLVRVGSALFLEHRHAR